VQGKIAIPVDDILTGADARTRLPLGQTRAIISQHDYKFRHISANTEQYKNSFVAAIPQSAVNTDSVSAFKTQLRSMS